MNQPNSLRWRKGFTLVEMVIVAAILGVLTAGSVSFYQDYIQQAREATARQNLRTVREAIGNYFKINMEYPTKFDQLRLSASVDSLVLQPLQDQTAQLALNIPNPGPPLFPAVNMALASNPFQVPLASMTYATITVGLTQYTGPDGQARQFNDIKIYSPTGNYQGF